MGARITMRDVAREAGVSPMTVSRAFKDDASVNDETRRMVKDAADRLGYVYDTTAQAFRAGRSGFLALTLPSINNANFAATHRALTESLAESGLQLLLGITDYDITQEEAMVRQLLARRPEAIILTGGAHTAAVRKLLTSLQEPVFEIWDLPEDPLDHVIGFSNADCMELVVAHLAEKGRRKIGFLGADPGSDGRGNARRLGTIDAAAKIGLPPVVDLSTGPAPATMTNGGKAVADRIDQIRGLDALVCVSDPVAFGAIMALEDAGLRVPDDISVTGFGDFEIARICKPAITTVDVGAERIGHLTGQSALKLLFEAETQAQPVSIRLSPSLLPRQSS